MQKELREQIFQRVKSYQAVNHLAGPLGISQAVVFIGSDDLGRTLPQFLAFFSWRFVLGGVRFHFDLPIFSEQNCKFPVPELWDRIR